MSGFISCKTHVYVTIKTWPSKYYMKMYHQHTDIKLFQKGAKKFNDYVDKHIEFKNIFYEFITNKPSENIYTDYLSFSDEAVIEEIREVSGVYICNNSGTITYCIPKNDKTEEIVEFIVSNSKLPTRQHKKTRGTYYDPGVSTFWRDKCKVHREEVMDSEWYKILAEKRKDEINHK